MCLWRSRLPMWLLLNTKARNAHVPHALCTRKTAVHHVATGQHMARNLMQDSPRCNWRSLLSSVLDFRCRASWQEDVTALSIKSSANCISSYWETRWSVWTIYCMYHSFVLEPEKVEWNHITWWRQLTDIPRPKSMDARMASRDSPCIQLATCKLSLQGESQ